MKFKFTKKKIVVLSIIGLVAVAGTAWAINASKPKLAEVAVKEVAVKDLSQTISVTGNIEANNSEQIALASTVKVLDVFVEEGQDIAKGTPILKLDAKDYEYQLEKMKLNVELTTLNLNKLQNENVANDKKALENTVAQSEINLNTSKRSFDKAKQDYENNKTLFEGGYISQDEYNIYIKAAEDAENQVSLMEIQLTNAKNNLADFDVDRQYQIDQQRKQLEMNRSDLANMNSQVGDTTIKSNIGGKVVKLDVKENQYPNPENSIIMIHDLSSYKINIEVSQYDAVTLSLGQKSEVKIKGLDKKYTGTVTYIGTIAELKQSGTNVEPKVEIEVTIDNPDEKIKVGYEADAEIVLTEKPRILAVNFESILKEADGKSYVFTVKDNKATKTYVTTGLETDFDIEIKEGLKDGDSYITNPPETLKDGDMIKIAGGETK